MRNHVRYLFIGKLIFVFVICKYTLFFYKKVMLSEKILTDLECFFYITLFSQKNDYLCSFKLEEGASFVSD